MYEYYRYVVFTKSLFFRKTVDFFSIFPKNKAIFPTTPLFFQSFFRKQPYFFTELPKITNFYFPENRGYFELIFNHNSTTNRFPAAGVRQMAPPAKNTKSPEHCYFHNNFLLQFGN